jgi:uncharacterized cupin superfamily protein
MPEARLERTDGGLAPAGEGWFVVGVRDSVWVESDVFGPACTVEGWGPATRDRADVDWQSFPQLGFTLAVLEPGKPSGLYHAEANQEDFLVLHGECLLLVEGEERRLRAWDFFHCPAGTEHILVGAGDGPCVVFMTGARKNARHSVFAGSELALRHGAGVERETDSPAEAYAPFGHWRPAPSPPLDGLPWG